MTTRRASSLRHYPMYLAVLLGMASIIYASYAADKQQIQQALPVGEREPLTILASHGRYSFEVEVLSRPEEMQRGLMFRQQVPDKTGMLFDFGVVRRVSMWMKNTIVPLDMLFIGADGTIVDIARNTVPFSMDIITSARPALAVLEVSAGTCNHYGIDVGDKVQHPLFNSGN